MENPLEALRKALDEGDLAAARAAMESLRRATHQANQLAAEVLHELRQPLLGIKAYSQMMDENAAPGTPVSLLLAQVERMEQIIADFTRIAADKPAPKERLSLGAAAQNAVRHFGLNPESLRISLEVEAAPDVEVLGNARLLEQLALNLLNNARDALNGRGRIKLVVSREDGAPTLMVADWGPGIPPDLRDRIFEPYVTGKARGSGLGLSVCKRIAQEHGAQIGLASPMALKDAPPPATVFRVTFATAADAVSRKRLLVVDDEAIIRMVFKDLMGKECDVIEAQTAEEAIELLRAGPYDLIITDKNLPGLSGLDLAQEARKADPNSRVIIMTGYPSLVTAQQALELGVIDYLLKPFDEIREVREKIRNALAAAPPARAPRPHSLRVDVYEDNPASARQITDALKMLGMEPNVLSEPTPAEGDPPAGVVVSWDFSPAHGKRAVELGRQRCRGAPFVVLAEHLTMDAALESLRGGAAACLPKLLSDVRALSRELSRALKLSSPID
ncbi:MAG TPA: hybrid histidine protein kinase/response regulator SinK [Myxococcales bacterium]|nr:hybrid histidine protein kinase/response regulator SinK [Myxococcales bacterium]